MILFAVQKWYFLFKMYIDRICSLLGCLLLDIVIIVLSLLLGMCSLKTSKLIKESLDEEESRRVQFT